MYNYPNSTSARLYISDLLGAPTYTGTNVIQNAVFTAAGQYNAAASNTAFGYINASSSSTRLHTSGVVTGVGGSYTPTGGGAASNIYKIQNASDWGTFLNRYGIWGDLTRSGSYNLQFTVDIPADDTYTFIASCSGTVTVRAGGTTAPFNVIVHTGPTTTTTNTKFLTAGSQTFRLIATTTAGAPGAVGVVAKNSAGEIVYQSTSPPSTSYDGVAQQIVMPKGGAWFTGVTKLALDAKASDINDYYVGAKLAVQSKYCYSYTRQTATYVPPPPPPRGGGGCCVVATAMSNNGDMSFMQLARINAWATKKLDKTWIGERFHRGYHIVGSHLLIPMMQKNSLTSKYIKWSFKNATNMLMGKKYNKWSIPNSLPWLASMMLIGLFVSKDRAEKSWKSLYKKDDK
jgi:hypothetical protein